MRRSILTALTGISALALATPAYSAVIVNGVSYNEGDSFQVFFNGVDEGGVVTGLSATLTLTFDDVDADGDYLFTYALLNSSDVTFHPSSELTGMGFDVDPDQSGSSTISATINPDDDLPNVSSGNIANGRSVEFCITGGPTCNGGGSSGPESGETATGTITLGFAADPGDITLSDFHVRYQSTGLDGQGSATGDQVPGVPEPGTWAMMLLGFGATGFAIRRSRRKGTGLLQLA
jgi:PEP-CTERM motif-containing protein